MTTALEKLRRDRKQLEELEAQVLAAPTDAQEMHAWAARELRVLSESIRQSKCEIVEMKTARPSLPPLPPTELPVNCKRENVEPDIVLPMARCMASDVMELEDEMVEKSEGRTLPFTVDVLASGIEALTTARRADSPVRLCNNSHSLTKSVSLDDDDSVFQDLRTCSPDPHPAAESAAVRAQRVLAEYVAAEQDKENQLRHELGQYAQSRLASGIAQKADNADSDELPALARIEKTTKNGVAFSFDFR